MKSFYTGAGDQGQTGLLGEGRISKSDLRMETLGSIDEAGAALGMARSLSQVEEIKEILLKLQRDLYKIMAEIASTPENVHLFKFVESQHVEWLEQKTDAISSEIEIPKEFIIPGDIPSGAALDLARTVVRRAERNITRLFENGMIQNPQLLRYFNRLSSLVFTLELFEMNRITGKDRPTLAKIDKETDQ